MQDVEVLLRLVEAASALPAVKVTTDAETAESRTWDIASKWYDRIKSTAKPDPIKTAGQQSRGGRDNRKAPN